jgi:hypothetical protein
VFRQHPEIRRHPAERRVDAVTAQPVGGLGQIGDVIALLSFGH